MKLSELAALAADEQKSEAFLQSRGLVQRFTPFPYCKSERLGRVRRRFYKSYGCVASRARAEGLAPPAG